MACITPFHLSIKRYRFDGSFYNEYYDVNCGRCIPCLIRKESALEFLAKKELLTKYRKGQGASFVTLTYDDGHIPYNQDKLVTLRKSDVQKFLKNVRRQMEYHNDKTPFKTIYCGEYGDNFGRPHYHIVFIGLSDSKVLKYTRKLWKHGLCDVGVLAQGGLRYVCKYMTKQHPTKEVKAMREKLGVENPFICHSIGLGKEWIINNIDKIAEDNFVFQINGKKYLYPSYVMKFVALRTGKDYKKAVRDFLVSENHGHPGKTYLEHKLSLIHI